MLRVTAPADLGDQLLSHIAQQVRHHYPKVSIDMLLVDRYVDLIAEGVDVAIRTGALRDSSLIAKYAGVAQWVPIASPDYLKTAPLLDMPQALRHHRCLQFTPLGRDSWTLKGETGSVTVPMTGQVQVNDIRVIRALAQAGEGIALLPLYLCKEDCAENRLVRVLPEWYAKADPVHLVYPRQRFMAPKLRAFIDLAIQELALWLA